MVETKVATCERCGRKNRRAAAAVGSPLCGNCGAPLPWVVDAGDDDFADVVEQSTIPVVVDMWAPWCGPCRIVSPALEQLSREFAGKVKLAKVNVDEAPKLSRRFTIQAIPSLLLFQDGEVIARQTGAAPVHTLRSWLERALAAAA